VDLLLQEAVQVVELLVAQWGQLVLASAFTSLFQLLGGVWAVGGVTLRGTSWLWCLGTHVEALVIGAGLGIRSLGTLLRGLPLLQEVERPLSDGLLGLGVLGHTGLIGTSWLLRGT